MSDDARDASGDGDEARDASVDSPSPAGYEETRRAYLDSIGFFRDAEDEEWVEDDEDEDEDEWIVEDDEDHEGERHYHGMSSFERPVNRVRFENEPEPMPQDPEFPYYSDSEIENYSLSTHMTPYYERAQSVVLETTCNHAQGADALRAVPNFVFDEGALEGEDERAFGPLRDTWVFHRMHATSFDETVAKRCTLGMPDFFSFRGHAVSMCVGGVAEGASPSEARREGELFTPYSMDYDEERRLLAVCGMGVDHNYTTFWNVVVYEIDASEETVGTGKNVNPDALYTEVCRLNVGLSDNRLFAPVRRHNLGMDFTDTVDQANCIRFARLEGVLGGTDVKSYLLLSSNDGHVYYIHLSEADEVTRARKAQVVKSENKQIPVNCAEPSPCGTMVASCGDSRRVGVTFLATPSVGMYCLPLQLEIPSLHPKLPHPRRGQGGHETHSCQYVRWSPDGRYLAATSDATHSITVWRMDGVNGRDPDDTVVPPVVAHFWDHARPVLPVVFAQHNPSIMVWAERKGRVHTFDVREAEDHNAEVADIVKDVPEEELAQLKTMKDGLQDVGCALVNMRRRLRPMSIKASKTWSRLDPVERRAIWKKSFVEGDVYKDFTLQTINHFRGFDDAYYATITGLTVSRVAPPQGAHGEDASDVIMCSTGRAVFAYRLVAGVRSDISNFLSFPLPSYIHSMQTFLLCVKASRRNGCGKTCLADLPTEILHEIMARASTPLYKWSGRRKREKERDTESQEHTRQRMIQLFNRAKYLDLDEINRDPDEL